MDQATYDWLTRLVHEAINHPQCSDWETTFIKDQEVRLERFGIDTRYSAKQSAVLDRIASHIGFEPRPEYY